MKIKLIIFDFSGTLAFWRPDLDKFFSFFKDFGMEIRSEKQIRNFITLFADLFWKAKDWQDFSRKIAKKIVKKPNKEKIEEISEFLKQNIVFELYEDAKEIEDLPIKKAILSGNTRFLIENLGLQKFAKIFTPKETKFLKPDPRAFLTILKKLKVRPEEALMVGDEIEKDIIPAKKLGMEAILIDRKKEIHGSPVKKINSLKELKQILRGL